MEITNDLIGVITAIASGVPDTAAAQAGEAKTAAVAAQAAAEAAATLAQEHSMGFSFADGVLTLEPITEGDE